MGSVGIFMSPLVSLIGRSTVDTENLSDRMNRADTDKNIATISTSATQLSGLYQHTDHLVLTIAQLWLHF